MRRPPNRPRRADLALLTLVRLACDGSWTVDAAGERLRAEVRDPLVLREARARVLEALAGRPGTVGGRSLAILDVALATGPTGTEPDVVRLVGEGSST
ncbi:hypothetical protein [Nocardioides sp.]|uniref:hypothetical protein n=1 Tax=Nocardioides sp. TaxID=35761 RepID=UPI003783133A